MLIGLNASASPTSQTDTSTDIIDVSGQDFEERVLKESMKRPVLIDFWAPWCGPCKQLVPVLEKTVAAQKGGILLAKINVDENPELAQAFRVQSVPMVIALYMGQPVTGFAGVRPQADIDQIMTQLLTLKNQNEPDALDIPESLKQAALFLDQGDFDAAHGLYAAILQQDPMHIDAYSGMVRVFIATGDIEQAELLVTNAPDVIIRSSQFAAAKTALELAQNTPDHDDFSDLENKTIQNPDDLDSHFALAELYFSHGEKDLAVDQLILIIRKNRTWEESKAQTLLLKYFAAWGFSDPSSINGRRKLSSILFS